jgi:apolipoprotein N-acyltransferase
MEAKVEAQTSLFKKNKAQRAKIVTALSLVLAPILSGGLLVLAYPRYDMAWLGWVGLVPLLIAITHRKPGYAFLMSFLCGLVFFAGVFDWIREVRGYQIIHHGVLGLYLGPMFGFFGLIYSFISRRRGATPALVAAPFIWVSIEYLRSNISFLSLPMALLAHSQSHYVHLIQFASFTGAYGIGFLMILANATVAILVLAFLPGNNRLKLFEFKLPSKRAAITLTLTSLILILVALFYGQTVLSQPINGKEIKVSVLQGNIAQKQKWDRKYASFIMQTYTDLTRQAFQDKPDLIVWPEASTPGLVLKNRRLYKQIVSMIRQNSAYFIIGSSEYPKFAKQAYKKGTYGNAALFFSQNGEFLGQYLKIRLVPFTECLPHKEIIPWPDFIVPDKDANFPIAGKEFKLFEMNGAKFGALICWETLHPDLFRQFVKDGANFIVNITNEARYGETKASYQIAAMNVFRAVESRVPVVRAANTGISCFIDPYGRITGRVRNDGKHIFVKGWLTQNILATQEKTFYTAYGDVFAYLSLIMAILTIAYTVLPRSKKGDMLLD